MDARCAEYILEIGLEHWARAHFPGNRYNIMTSNLAESWNAVLREAREFPEIPLIDFIRTKLTEWFATLEKPQTRIEALSHPWLQVC